MSLTSLTGSTMSYLQRLIDKHTNMYQDTMEQLSSGSKYNSISDNPVEVCNSVKLGVEIQTNETADSNIAVGNDMLSMASSSQEDILSNIQRIHDLTVEISNGTYSSSDKNAILGEIKNRLDYIDKASDSTNFNGIYLLNGSAISDTLTLQVGTNSNNRIYIGDALIDTHTTALDINLDTVTSIDDWTEDDIANYLDKLDTAAKTVISADSKIGSYQNRLDFVSESLSNINTNLTAKKSSISDADVAEVSAELVKNQILQQASVSVFTQANQVSSLALSLLGK